MSTLRPWQAEQTNTSIHSAGDAEIRKVLVTTNMPTTFPNCGCSPVFYGTEVMRQPNYPDAWFCRSCKVWFVPRDSGNSGHVLEFMARKSIIGPSPFTLLPSGSLLGVCHMPNSDGGFTNAGTSILGLISGEIVNLFIAMPLDLDNSFLVFCAIRDDSQKRAYSHTAFTSFDVESNPLLSACLSLKVIRKCNCRKVVNTETFSLGQRDRHRTIPRLSSHFSNLVQTLQ